MLAYISYPPIPAWEVGPVALSLHGLFAALGFLAGAWLATIRVRRSGLDSLKYQSVITWGLIGAILGARYLTAPAAIIDGVPILDALHPVRGNFSMLGGFAGGIGAGAWRMHRLGLPVLPTLDATAFGLALGAAVGRIGDLAIVEHLGQPTSVAWGYGVRPGYELAPMHRSLQCVSTDLASGLCPVPGSPGLAGIYHHTALYDMIGALLLLGVLFWVAGRLHLAGGQLFFLWMAWYGAQRGLIIDPLRAGTNTDAMIGPITWNQLSGLLAAVAGVYVFLYLGRRSRREAQIP